MTDTRLKELRAQLREAKAKNKSLEAQQEALRKQEINEYKIECQIRNLSHRFVTGDWVVVRKGKIDTGHTIAQVMKTKGDSQYELGVPVPGFKGHTYTQHKCSDADIICHVAGLVLPPQFSFSPTKWTNRPMDDVVRG